MNCPLGLCTAETDTVCNSIEALASYGAKQVLSHNKALVEAGMWVVVQENVVSIGFISGQN